MIKNLIFPINCGNSKSRENEKLKYSNSIGDGNYFYQYLSFFFIENNQFYKDINNEIIRQIITLN